MRSLVVNTYRSRHPRDSPATSRRILPVGMGVSCSADCNIKAKINRQGIWIEKLEHNPGKYIRKSCAKRRRRSGAR
ncbi:hypothetical protein ACVXG9_01085 [Escherichia coli]